MGRKSDPALEAQDQELLTHIHSLGLQAVEEYREWCAQNGLSRKLKKDWRQRSRERSIAQKSVIEQRLIRKKREQRKPTNPGRLHAKLFAEHNF
jgi:hypothetical protein